MKKSKSKKYVRSGAFVGIAVLTALNANSQTASNVEKHAVYTSAISVAWAQAYPSAAAHLDATNADGMSNYDKMVALLPPDDQSLNIPQIPKNIAAASGLNANLGANLTPAENLKKLHDLAVTARAALARARADFEAKSLAAKTPRTLQLGDGKIGTLVDVDDAGNATYVAPNDIYAASTSHADQLWPAGAVTAVSGWTSGASGLNLNGSGQIVDMFEADYTAGNAGVQTAHKQFFDPTVGVIRVSQGDSTGLSPHATEVAGILTSGGLDDFFNLGPSAPSVNLGNYSRGIGYAGNVNAWSLTSYQGNFLDESGNGVPLINNSWGEIAGWVLNGANWVWYGGSNANDSDWQFGAYVGSYTGPQGGNAPRQLDNLSYTAPNTLLLFAAGNALNTGPGHAVTYYLSTDPTFLHPQTATKNWLNGDAGGYRTISPSPSAKDVLTVGGVFAITPPGYSTASDVFLAPFSSVGPTTDGRIKPEVVAPALVSTTVSTYNPLGLAGLVTPAYDPANPTVVNNYSQSQGTSFSSPTVAAGLGLVLQERLNVQPGWANNGFPILSSTLRALAVHTADPAGANPGPSYAFGYGLFDAENAVNLVAADAATAPHVADGEKPYVKEVDLPSGSFIQYNVYATSSSTPLKVTLAWTDPQGSAQTAGVENDSTARLVNDLDLRVYPPGTTTFNPSASTTYKPWILNPDLVNRTTAARGAAATTGDDTRNNLEQVVVNSPLTGSGNPYIVRVTYKGSLKNNSGALANDQWASLIMSGNNAVSIPFVFTQFAPQPNGQFLMTWSAVVGGDYVVQSTSSLLGPWTDVTPILNANLEAMSVVVTPSGPSMFYRVARYY